MRLFIAIEIPDDIKKEMAEIQRRLKGAGVDASWIRPEGIHLTLKFMGEVPESRAPEIMNSLTNVAGGTGVFRIDVAGVGTFPKSEECARCLDRRLSGDEKISEAPDFC